MLIEAVTEILPRKIVHKKLQLQPSQGAFRAALYNHKAVINESFGERGDLHLEIQLPESDFFRLIKESGLKIEDLDTI